MIDFHRNHACATRDEFIAKGIITGKPPTFAIYTNTPLTADELDRRGYDIAADAQRRYDTAIAEWREFPHRRPPQR